MTQLQIVLCALVGALFTSKGSLINCDCTNFVPFTFSWLLGAILGDWKTGLIIGATIQTVNMAGMVVGGVQTMNLWFAAVIAVPLCIGRGMSMDIAMVLAGPLSILYAIIVNAVELLVADLIANPIVDKRCREADWKRLAWDEIIVFYIPRTIIFFIVCYVCIAGGAAIVDTVLDKIPAWLNLGMSATSGLLPAIGFGLFLYMMGNKKLIPFFFVGFYMAKYLGFGNILVGIIGVLIGIIYLGILDEAKSEKVGL